MHLLLDVLASNPLSIQPRLHIQNRVIAHAPPPLHLLDAPLYAFNFNFCRRLPHCRRGHELLLLGSQLVGLNP